MGRPFCVPISQGRRQRRPAVTKQPADMKTTTDTETDRREHLIGVAQVDERIAEARKRAFVYLHDTRTEKPVVTLEKMVEHLDQAFLETLDISDDTQLILACATAAIIAVKKRTESPETASGIIALAEVELLS